MGSLYAVLQDLGLLNLGILGTVEMFCLEKCLDNNALLRDASSILGS